MSLLLIISSFAQIRKGLWLVDANIGNLAATKSKDKDLPQNTGRQSKGSNFHFVLYPRIGYFISKKIVIGSGLYFSYINSHSNYYQDNKLYSQQKSSSSNLGISPFIRYYIPLKNETTNFYFQIGGGYDFTILNKSTGISYSEIGEEIGRSNYSGNSNNLFGEGHFGINHFINSLIALNASLAYRYLEFTAASKSNWYYINSNYGYWENKWLLQTHSVTWNIGLSIFISKNKDEKKSE